MIKTCKCLKELISQHIILVPAYLFYLYWYMLIIHNNRFHYGIFKLAYNVFYHAHPYDLFLFPSPTHWIPSFSLLVLLLHSHLYLLFFYDLVTSITAASNILGEGLVRRACTLSCGCNNGGKCTLVLNAGSINHSQVMQSA